MHLRRLGFFLGGLHLGDSKLYKTGADAQVGQKTLCPPWIWDWVVPEEQYAGQSTCMQMSRVASEGLDKTSLRWVFRVALLFQNKDTARTTRAGFYFAAISSWAVALSLLGRLADCFELEVLTSLPSAVVQQNSKSNHLPKDKGNQPVGLVLVSLLSSTVFWQQEEEKGNQPVQPCLQIFSSSAALLDSLLHKKKTAGCFLFSSWFSFDKNKKFRVQVSDRMRRALLQNPLAGTMTADEFSAHKFR